MTVTKEEIRAARCADLYDYLLCRHPDEFGREGHWLRMKSHPTICLKKGCGGFKDYLTLETGNSIDFLVRYMNYGFTDAVTSLVSQASTVSPKATPACKLVFPPRSATDTAVIAYLLRRGFPDSVITNLETAGLLYQDRNRNAVFRSSTGDFYESRGTWAGKPFHQCGKESSDCFWAFMPGNQPEKAYICESAIDAVSLYLLHLNDGES